jgi:hypothetical protein
MRKEFRDGVSYTAQACGAPAADGLWEGWIEFIPIDGGAPIRSPRETTQPNRTDARYWATGLSAVYLEGALRRALRPLVVRTARAPRAMFEAPAPALNVESADVARVAILDPFSVYKKGDALLRHELGALSAWHLANIAIAYRLSDMPGETLAGLPRTFLVSLIVAAVRLRVRDDLAGPR